MFAPWYYENWSKAVLAFSHATIDCEGHNLLLSQSKLFSPLRSAQGSLATARPGLDHH